MSKTKRTINTNERLSAIERVLRAKASEPESCCWLMDEDGNDSDESYCFDCIKTLIANPVHGENYARAGYAFECDNPMRCEECGKLLEYILTDYGIEQELGHFTEYPPKNLDNADECHELARIAAGLQTSKQKTQFLKLFRGIRIEAETA